VSSYSFTSESVCAGHPDKVADQISDAILDEALRQDPHARTAIETAVTANRIMLLGEIRLDGSIDYAAVARTQVKHLGYTNPGFNFSDKAGVDVYIRQQSTEIAAGVDLDGAGDQGLMFGYACRETKELMPLPITLAHALTRAIDTARETKALPYLYPDGKAQVTIRYEDGKPTVVEHVTIAVPHSADVTIDDVRQDIHEKIVRPTLAAYNLEAPESNIIVNGTGVWHSPGPAVDAGLTGRKIVVDGYGGYARVGGGAFSGKDATKVDRSGAYAARYIAKNIVAANLADRCEVSLAYYIGAKQPVMTQINTFGTAKGSEGELNNFATSLIDTSVKGIIEKLELRKPVFLQTAAYGHFGKLELSWEQIKK